VSDFNVRSYVSRKDGVILSVCQTNDVMSEFLDWYVKSNNEQIPVEDFDDLKRIISFCCAMVPFIPSDGLYAWTVSLPFKKKKIFCSIDMSSKTYVARTHKWDPPETENSPRVAFQKISNSQNVNSVSVIDCTPDECKEDVIGSLIKKYTVSIENRMLYVKETSDTTMILKIYEKKDDINQFLIYDDLEAKGLSIINKLDHLYGYEITFHCGCNKSIISSIFSSLDKESFDFLFEKGDEITTECPRCGYKYKYKREEIKKQK
jgi:hypothetical protein